MKFSKTNEWVQDGKRVQTFTEVNPEDKLNPCIIMIRNGRVELYDSEGELDRVWAMGKQSSGRFYCQQTGKRSKFENIFKNEGWEVVA